MIPSTPVAVAARASGVTALATPVPCDGSTTMGRWVMARKSGNTPRSSVLRVMVSNVRMPRSQRITL